MDLFSVPTSVQGITPSVGIILVESEARHAKGEVAEPHLFYNRPVAGASYTPVGQRLLPLDDEWRRKLATQPWPRKSLPALDGDGGDLNAKLKGWMQYFNKGTSIQRYVQLDVSCTNGSETS